MEGSCEQELRFLHRLVRGTEIGIDVGANEGLYSYRMSNLFAKVYAFEVNPETTKELEAYGRGNIEIIHKGLSSSVGGATLYVPVVRHRPLTGWASLDPGNCPGSERLLKREVEVLTLDSLQIHPVSFMKIDVEGHEVEVLKGASQTVSRDRPIVLVEIKSANLESVCSFFRKLGYSRKQLRELIGVVGSAENHIFIPDERE